MLLYLLLRNFDLNEFRGEQYRFVRYDVRNYVAQLPKEEQFDVVVVDAWAN